MFKFDFNELGDDEKFYNNYIKRVFDINKKDIEKMYTDPSLFIDNGYNGDDLTKVYYYLSEPKNIGKIVDGYFTIIRTKNGDYMCVNEDAILINLPLNNKASSIAGMKIYGDVVVFPDFEGNNNKFRFGLL